jgi:hypothetical protein
MNNDLISRSALLEFAHNHIGGIVDCNDIARFPAVDAVEVVRCKDCYFGKLLNSETVLCVEEKLLPTRTSPDFFCASGKCKTVAAVKDMKMLAHSDSVCDTCAHYAFDEEDESRACTDCDVETYNNWQWRGVEVE